MLIMARDLALYPLALSMGLYLLLCIPGLWSNRQ